MKTLCVYQTVFDLLNEARPDLVSALSKDETCFLQSLDDYESFGYVLLDGSNVVIYDRLSDDVIQEQTLDEYAAETLAYIREETEE